MQLTTKFLNREFTSPLMNAAGVFCETSDQMNLIKNSSAGAVISKTATMEAREGNPTPRMAKIPLGSINSMGLPNLGIDYYLDYMDQQPDKGEKMFLSTTGIEPDDFGKLLHKIQNASFAGITELNLSCPNVPGHPQVAYDFKRTDEILADTFKTFTKPLGVKLPPYFDLAHFDEMAAILNKYPIKYVNCINSVGNGLFINPDTDTVLIKPKTGFGGIGGRYIKPVALANVWAFHQRLRDDIAIIGTGGVENGQDVYELILAGATMVQVGTQLGLEGPEAFDRLNEELAEAIERKGFSSVNEVSGKLKIIE